MLDNRLKKCAELVSGKGIACDVGTDHAYLAAELVISGKCDNVIACDINEGPLEAAAKTVKKYGVADKVQLVLSDGLDNVPREDISDIIIAGMGGETIADILKRAVGFDSDVQYILQPMTKIDVLRGFLGKYGFKILSETAVEDGGHAYVIIQTVYDGVGFEVSEFKNIRGFVDRNDAVGRKYLEMQANSLRKKADSLKQNGMNGYALHNYVMAENLLSERESVSVNEIYEYLDSLYPFRLQENWDNSGFIVEKNGYISTILLTLDIDINAVAEATWSGAELVISHHPVIFKPLKKLTDFSPVTELIRHDIGAICMHTNLDIAKGGTNSIILKELMRRFEINAEIEPFEECGNGECLGYIITLKNCVSCYDFGENLKSIFGCEYVRMNRHNSGNVEKLAFCSGSGGSMLELAIEKGCDTLITGDVKHDVWIEANNQGVNLFDCGHFHTENLVLWELRKVLEKKFPQLEVIVAECSADPCVYIK